MGARLTIRCDAPGCNEDVGYTLLGIVPDGAKALERLRGEGWIFRPHQRDARLIVHCPLHATHERAPGLARALNRHQRRPGT